MLLSEFIKDFGVKKYFRTPKNIEYSLLANFIQLVLEGEWIGKLPIKPDFSENPEILAYFRVLDPENFPTRDALRFGDVYIINGTNYRYGVYLNSNAVIEQPNHLTPNHAVLKDNIQQHIDWVKTKGYEVVLLRPLNEKNIFPSDDLRYIKQDKPFAHASLDEENSSYIVYAPGNHITYDDPIWASDPTNKQIEILAKQEIYRPLYLHVLDDQGNSLDHVEGDFDTPFSRWRLPETSLNDDSHMFALITKESDFEIKDIKWTGTTAYDELNRKSDITVTVGTTGNYATVNEAIHALSHLKPLTYYEKDGFKAIIELQDGFVMGEQVFVRNQDLSWITIVSEDNVEIEVNPALITESLQKDDPLHTDDLIPIFGAINAKLPIIGTLFAYPDDGDGYCADSMDGIAVINSSHVTLLPGAGVKRPRSGLKVLYDSSAACYPPGMTQGGGGTGGGTVTGANFSYAQRLAVHVGYGSKANLARTIADHSKGEYGFYVIWGSHADFYQSQVHHTINGYAITCRDGSFANMRDTDVSYSVRGYHALHNGRINARRSEIEPWSVNSAKFCTEYGVLASNNSHIDAAKVDVSNCFNRGVHASDASSIAFNDGALALNCVVAAVGAVQASIVDAAGADVSGSGIGFDAQNGSTINAQETIANNCVLVTDVAISGVAYRAQQMSNIQAYNGQADNCARYGVYADRGSKVNARGSTAQNAGIYGYAAVEGAEINARTSNATGAGTFGYYIERGSFLVIGEPGSTVVNGTVSQTINVYNGLGAILNDNLPTPIDPTLAGGVVYKGAYNASTNTPNLVNGTGHTGDMYRVSTAGSRDFGAGAIDLAIGDYVIYNGSTWEKIDGSDQVASVFGRTGAVTAQNGDYDAGQITSTPTGNISATTVQAAIAELESETLHKATNETVTGEKIFAPTNSLTAFIIGNLALTTHMMRVDTTNGRIGFKLGAASALNSDFAFNGLMLIGGGSGTATALADIQASTTSRASARIRQGVAPSSPNEGDIWQSGNNLFIYVNGAVHQLDRQATTGQTYTVSNYTPQRTLDVATASLADVMNVLATLIADLKTTAEKIVN